MNFDLEQFDFEPFPWSYVKMFPLVFIFSGPHYILSVLVEVQTTNYFHAPEMRNANIRISHMRRQSDMSLKQHIRALELNHVSTYG
jgi:hypothetical protein